MYEKEVIRKFYELLKQSDGIILIKDGRYSGFQKDYLEKFLSDIFFR